MQVPPLACVEQLSLLPDLADHDRSHVKPKEPRHVADRAIVRLFVHCALRRLIRDKGFDLDVGVAWLNGLRI